jgi:hypothetical protein
MASFHLATLPQVEKYQTDDYRQIVLLELLIKLEKRGSEISVKNPSLEFITAYTRFVAEYQPEEYANLQSLYTKARSILRI